jgi:hypothetical protein
MADDKEIQRYCEELKVSDTAFLVVKSKDGYRGYAIGNPDEIAEASLQMAAHYPRFRQVAAAIVVKAICDDVFGFGPREIAEA